MGVFLSMSGGIAVSYWRSRNAKPGDPFMGVRSEARIGLLLLASFALGSFVTYVMLNIRF